MGQPEQHHRQSSMLLVDRYIVTEPPRPCFRCEVRFVRQRGSPSDCSTPLSSEAKFKRRNFARCKFCPAPPCHSSRFGASSRHFAHFLQYVVGGLEGIEASWNTAIDRGVQTLLIAPRTCSLISGALPSAVSIARLIMLRVFLSSPGRPHA